MRQDDWPILGCFILLVGLGILNYRMLSPLRVVFALFWVFLGKKHPAQHPDQHPDSILYFLLRPPRWHPDSILAAAVAASRMRDPPSARAAFYGQSPSLDILGPLNLVLF